jgi:hypothetical protein
LDIYLEKNNQRDIVVLEKPLGSGLTYCYSPVFSDLRQHETSGTEKIKRE